MRTALTIARRSNLGALAALAMMAALSSHEAAAQAETVLQNVRLGPDTMSYEAPRLIVRGSRLSQAELARLLDPAATEPWADRVMKLEAEEILVPELIATIKMPQVDQRTTYRDVSIKRVAGGKVASVTASGGTMEGTQQGKRVTGSNGPVTMQDLDAGAAFSLMAAKGNATDALKRIYGAFSIDAIKVIDQTGITTQIGRISGRDFSAKPTSLGWMGTMEALAAAEAAKGSPDALRKTLDAFAELMEAMSLGAVEASDISMKGKVEKDDVDLDVAIRKVAYTGGAAGRPGEFRVEGSNIAAGGARISYGVMSFGGIDAKPVVEAIREIAKNPDNPSPAVLRRLLPIMSSIKVENIEVDIPEDGPGSSASGARTKFGLGRFEITAEKPIEGIPTDLRIVLRNIGMPVPANSDNEGLAMLAQLGYDRLDGSLAVNIGWNEAGQEIVVRDISIDGKDMGTATLRGVIGKVSRDAFDLDTAVATAALIGASAKSVELTVDNRGLFEKIIGRESRRQKRQPEDIRREYGMAAAIGIPAILGNNPASKTVGQAVAKFVTKPGKLTIQARAKRASGYGLSDYMVNPSPAGVLEALDITASAE